MRSLLLHAAAIGLLLGSSAPQTAAQSRPPLPSTSEGTYLTGNLRQAVFDQLRAALDAENLPSAWIDELARTPPAIRFSDIGDNQGLYQPVWQGPLGNGLEGDTIHLKPGLSPLHLTDDEISTITHEAWHAWFDFVPTYPASPVSRFSDAQEEAIGAFIGELVAGNGLANAVSYAITEATGGDRGGTAQQAVDAIITLENAWEGSFFANGFKNDADVRRWATLARVNPQIQALESYLSDEDRRKLQERRDELERQREAEGDVADEVESTVQLHAGDGIHGSAVETSWGFPVRSGTDALFESGGTGYPLDGGLALTTAGGPAFTNAPTADPLAPWIHAHPDSLNPSGAASFDRAEDVQLMIVMYLKGTVPGGGRSGELGFRVGGRLASLAGLPRAIGSPETSAAPPLRGTIAALGVSSGAAFTVEIANAGPHAIDVAAAGVVVEPLRPKEGERIRKELGEAAAGRPTLQLTADGYCLEFLREPPSEGTIFRVAGPEIQKRFQPMRSILRAARKLMDAGRLSPDSDPEQYFHSILQWALWSRERGFDAKSFGKAFLERTRKNFEAARKPWTEPIQRAVEALAPNRWKDVETILGEARLLDEEAARRGL